MISCQSARMSGLSSRPTLAVTSPMDCTMASAAESSSEETAPGRPTITRWNKASITGMTSAAAVPRTSP